MKLLLSGEGPTDIGTRSQDNTFLHGPMTCFIDILATPVLGYSPRDIEGEHEDILVFCSKQELLDRGKPGITKLAGKKYGKNRSFFTANAQVLGSIANQKMHEENCPYIAVLFRDGDGSRSKDEWQEKWDSIVRGFALEDFNFGVPMVPRPKSEAWLLQAHMNQENPSETYETRTGNRASSFDMKAQLELLIEGHPSREYLVQLIDEGIISPKNISAQCSSFRTFRDALVHALTEALQGN